ncbi:hypothetical protein MNEG_2891 [Monoraphidium neglectum]|uniref:Uncharacterized protein n=1 Tax=Monoraphidium neglectum TaxID=145388 RepID=A0A0D2MR41_9CHLO|nr:hypothetical protein MNEG_2891 [Monoraphidium neglectum]KIZ05070.1 hypothetical protein MNEG_2891 [Monoraphidium neglectum]|eukprot:XP_013904089.1 hypothetical protein MNEG_2891 [Monoraphidium neglectum]
MQNHDVQEEQQRDDTGAGEAAGWSSEAFNGGLGSTKGTPMQLGKTYSYGSVSSPRLASHSSQITPTDEAVIVSMGLEWALEQETAKGLEQGLNNESDTTCLVFNGVQMDAVHSNPLYNDDGSPSRPSSPTKGMPPDDEEQDSSEDTKNNSALSISSAAHTGVELGGDVSTRAARRRDTAAGARLTAPQAEPRLPEITAAAPSPVIQQEEGSAHGGMEGRLPPRVEARFAAEGARYRLQVIPQDKQEPHLAPVSCAGPTVWATSSATQEGVELEYGAIKRKLLVS